MLLDGAAVKSCVLLIGQANGKSITTIEGLGTAENPHPIQQAFVDHFAIQCAATGRRNDFDGQSDSGRASPGNGRGNTGGLHGNLCRCTGYFKIVEAIEAARDSMQASPKRSLAARGNAQ